MNGFVINVDVDSGNDERRHVGTVKRVQTSGVDFYSPVSTHQLMSADRHSFKIYNYTNTYFLRSEKKAD